jgi:uncharacterized protein
MTILVDVVDLLGSPGSTRRLSVREPVAGMSTAVAAIPEDRPVEATLLLESLVEGILVSGEVRGPELLSCARCLKPVEAELRLELRELFAPGATAEDDEYPVTDGSIDLEPMLRDAILLAMPFAPLCGPDCQGLCERCGGDRNLGECRCEPETDSRWAALAGLEIEPAAEPETRATTTNGRS